MFDPGPAVRSPVPEPFPYWYLILMVTFALPGIFAFAVIALSALSEWREQNRIIRDLRRKPPTP